MAIEIVDLPIKNGGSFHSYVSLLEGISTIFQSYIDPLLIHSIVPRIFTFRKSNMAEKSTIFCSLKAPVRKTHPTHTPNSKDSKATRVCPCSSNKSRGNPIFHENMKKPRVISPLAFRRKKHTPGCPSAFAGSLPGRMVEIKKTGFFSANISKTSWDFLEFMDVDFPKISCQRF